MIEYKLSDLFDLQMGKTPSRNNPEYWNSNDNKWISIGDLSKCGKYISETKEYRKRLSEMYKEKQDGHRTPDDIFSLMKAENIQGKILDWLQNDGFLHSRKYTWDKVYKKD